MTANPTGGWVTQQARNLLLVLEERGRQLRYLLRDRDTKFYRAFDEVFCSEGAEILLTPVQAPNELNAAKDQQGKVRRRDLFGGLLHEYWRAA